MLPYKKIRTKIGGCSRRYWWLDTDCLIAYKFYRKLRKKQGTRSTRHVLKGNLTHLPLIGRKSNE